MIVEKFAIFFGWFYAVYTALLLLLIVKFTPTDGAAIFLLLHSGYLGSVFAIRQLFPGFVARAADLGVIKMTRPLVALSMPVSLYVLGMLGERYHVRGASYDFVYPMLLVLQVMLFVAFAEVSGKNGFFIQGPSNQ